MCVCACARVVCLCMCVCMCLSVCVDSHLFWKPAYTLRVYAGSSTNRRLLYTYSSENIVLRIYDIIPYLTWTYCLQLRGNPGRNRGGNRTTDTLQKTNRPTAVAYSYLSAMAASPSRCNSLFMRLSPASFRRNKVSARSSCKPLSSSSRAWRRAALCDKQNDTAGGTTTSLNIHVHIHMAPHRN